MFFIAASAPLKELLRDYAEKAMLHYGSPRSLMVSVLPGIVCM
jgi:hypothetical protein